MWKGNEAMLRNSSQRLGFQTPKFVVENPVIKGKPSSGFPYCLLRFSFFVRKLEVSRRPSLLLFISQRVKSGLRQNTFWGRVVDPLPQMVFGSFQNRSKSSENSVFWECQSSMRPGERC